MKAMKTCLIAMAAVVLIGLTVAMLAPACSTDNCSQSCTVDDDCPWAYQCLSGCCTNQCEDNDQCYHCPYAQCGGPYCDTTVNECKCATDYDGGTDGGSGDGGC